MIDHKRMRGTDRIFVLMVYIDNRWDNGWEFSFLKKRIMKLVEERY